MITGLVASGAVVATTITDTFSEANGTNLHGKATTTGGATWTVHNGTMDVQSGKARPTAGSGSSWATVDGTANFDLTVTVTYHSDFDGIMARVVDANNYLRVQVNSSTNAVDLIKNVAGSESIIGAWGVGASPGETATLRLLAVGSSLKVYVGVTLRIDASDSAHSTATKHGIIGGNATHTRFDDFSLVPA